MLINRGVKLFNVNQLVPPYNPPNKHNYAHWENFFSPEELEKILNLPEWEEKEKGMIGNENAPATNETLRRTDVSWVEKTPETAFIWNRLALVIAEINSRFFHFDITGLYENIQLGCYKGKDLGHYGWHVDTTLGSYGVMRKLSVALLLSDPSEFEGGELQLKFETDEPVAVEQAKGRAWFFPSFMMHRVTPVTKGVRKSLVIWAGGPPFK